MLAIVSTHPIQYQVPIWKAMAADSNIDFEVWYLTHHGTKQTYDPQFGRSFAWDIDLLGGYPNELLKVNQDPKVNQFRKLYITESIERKFKEKGVTALWINGWQVLAYWQLAWVAHRMGIPVILRGETNDLRMPKPYIDPIRKILLNQLFKRIRYFLYIGKANRRFYESMGIQAHQFLPGHYCIDNKRFKDTAMALKPQRALLREKFKIPSNRFCLLFSGKLITKKRPFDLIKALELMPLEIRKKFHLLFVGSGELSLEVQEQCKNLSNDTFDNGGSIATFPGFLNQTEIIEAYVAADALVLPSDSGETWGLVVNEAMACGLPALVSQACGSSEDLIIEGVNGYTFPCGDVLKLSEQIQSLESSKSISEFGESASKTVQKYDIQVTIDSLSKILSIR